jgi:hypothetical protein
MKTSLSFICYALCSSFLSIIHGLYSSLSETRDWAWSAPKLQHSWYRLNFVGEIIRWLSLVIQSHLTPRLKNDSTPFLGSYVLFYFIGVIQPLLKLYVERERWMCIILVSFFQLLILGWETVTSVLKTKKINTVDDGNRSVLWHSKKTAVNLIRRINKH